MLYEHSKARETLIVILGAILLAGVGFVIWKDFKTPPEPEEVYCTQDAKLCPDGSYVGRTGPNCEFTPCPSEALCEGGKCPESNLPKGYTLESYSVEKITDMACLKNSDCTTPAEYLIQSRCPFTSVCLEISGTCAVVCPVRQDITWEEMEALIKDCQAEKLGQFHNRQSFIQLKDGRKLYSVEPELDRILNLAELLEGKCGKIPVMTE